MKFFKNKMILWILCEWGL